MKKLHTFLLAAAVFLAAAALCFSLCRVGAGENVIVRHVSDAEIMRGGDDPGADYIELLPGEKVDINTAGAEELMKLPGIGEVLARNIISYRQAHGSFDDIEEIMEVEGIGEGRFDGIRLLITAGQAA